MVEDTTIRLKRDTWKRLHAMKEPGDTFDDVLNDVLDKADVAESRVEEQPAD
jgi:predicted CopG family antitoxin